MMEGGAAGESERLSTLPDRFEEEGKAGLIDHRLDKASPKRIAAAGGPLEAPIGHRLPRALYTDPDSHYFHTD